MKRYLSLIVLMLLMLIATPVNADPFVYESGYSMEIFADGLGTAHDLIVNPSGNIYLTETNNERVLHIEVLSDDNVGSISVYGTGIPDAEGIALDAAGDVFVSNGDKIYKIVDGVANPIGSGFADPEGLAFDQNGDLYLAEDGDDGVNIKKIDILEDGSIGDISNFASISSGGNAASIVFDSNGDLFVADNEDEVWKIEILENGSVAKISTFIGGLYTPYGLEFDNKGNLFVGASASGDIWKISPNRKVSLFANGWTSAVGLAFDKRGNLYVSDEFEGRIYRINKDRNKLEVADCDLWKYSLENGELLTFMHGIGFGDWDTAVEEREDQEAFFFLDGELLEPVYYHGLTLHGPDFYGDSAYVDWDAKPGEHTIQSYWTHPNEGYPGDICTFKIIPSGGTPSVAQEILFADGDVGCSGADDLSTPVGKVYLHAHRPGMVFFNVTLENAAPNWQYYVEISLDGVCFARKQFRGLITDEFGNGKLVGYYSLPFPSYRIQVKIVSDPATSVPPNPQHHEISTNELIYLERR